MLPFLWTSPALLTAMADPTLMNKSLTADSHGRPDPTMLPATGEVNAYILTPKPEPTKPVPATGEVALPGGKRDPEDADLTAAALREAWEETRLDRGRVKVLGSLQPLLSKHGYQVRVLRRACTWTSSCEGLSQPLQQAW